MYGPVAHRIEHEVADLVVEGSTPSRPSCVCSSGDRANGSGPLGRRFNSCQTRCLIGCWEFESPRAYCFDPIV